MGPDLDIGRDTERMRVLLADDGPLKTSELRERLGFEKNQRVNYRGKRVLGSGRKDDDKALGFVTNDGNPGSSTEELT